MSEYLLLLDQALMKMNSGAKLKTTSASSRLSGSAPEFHPVEIGRIPNRISDVTM
jgi:hypothetical protein